MMNELALQDILGLASNALAYTAFLLWAMSAKQQLFWVKCVLLGLALFFALFPILNTPLVIYFRGVLGDLSVATWMLSLNTLMLVFRGRALLEPNASMLFYGLVAMLALLLYPFALGWGQSDTYRLGYEFAPFEWFIFLLASIAVWHRNYWIGAWLMLSLIAYFFKSYESLNLWDYLIDPVAAFIAMVHVVHWLISSEQPRRFLLRYEPDGEKHGDRAKK